MSEGPYLQLVFSGGGTRCFWHGGFMEVAGSALDIDPMRLAGVSGGALSAACFIADRERALLDIMGELLEIEDENVEWRAAAREADMTPHQAVYRETVRRTLNAEAEARVADGPAFQILIARPPVESAPRASTVPLLAAYELDLQLRSTPEMTLPAAAGLTGELIDARQAAAEGKLVDLVCNAAVIPPVFEPPGWDGRPVVDGGLYCKAPMPEPDEGRTLVLLTRRFRNLPQSDRHDYVQVSEETPADKLDFTSREKIERTWEMGREDARRWLETR